MELKKNENFRNKIIKELNKCRANPSSYIDLINSNAEYFTGKIFMHPDFPGLMTTEGVDAYKEAVQFLSTAPSGIPPMKYSPGLSHIAHDFIKDLQLSEDLDVEANLPFIQKILKKNSNIIDLKDLRYYSEFLSISPEMFIINLIVCDGDPKREIRNTLFNPEFNFVGVAAGNNFLYNHVTSIFFARNFNEKKYTDLGKKRASVYVAPLEIFDPNSFDINVYSPLFVLGPDIEKMERVDKIIRENGQKIQISKVMIYTKDGKCHKKILKQAVND